jgi:hypothetical protein
MVMIEAVIAVAAVAPKEWMIVFLGKDGPNLKQ